MPINAKCPPYTAVIDLGTFSPGHYETLFLELALRGYDLSKLRDEPTTANIIKIG